MLPKNKVQINNYASAKIIAKQIRLRVMKSDTIKADLMKQLGSSLNPIEFGERSASTISPSSTECSGESHEDPLEIEIEKNSDPLSDSLITNFKTLPSVSEKILAPYNEAIEKLGCTDGGHCELLDFQKSDTLLSAKCIERRVNLSAMGMGTERHW